MLGMSSQDDVSPTRLTPPPSSQVVLTGKFGMENTERLPLVTTRDLMDLHEVGIFTVRELAEADATTILKLRGYDVPMVPEEARLQFAGVCDARALAVAVMEKCAVDMDVTHYDGEESMPWNVEPEFGGEKPTIPMKAKWHGVAHQKHRGPVAAETWDGCAPSWGGTTAPVNVNGLGEVEQLVARDHTGDLAELHCRSSPLPRAFFGAQWFFHRVWLVGGQSEVGKTLEDAWCVAQRWCWYRPALDSLFHPPSPGTETPPTPTRR